MPRSALPAVVALHVAVALFGFAGLFGKWLALAPSAIVLGRTVVAALSLAAFAGVRGTHARPDAGMAVNGVILAAHWTSFFAAIQWSTVAIGLLGYATFPLFVLMLERRPRGAPGRHREAITAALVSAGIVVLVPSFDVHDRALGGLVLGIVSGFTFAWLTVRGKRYAATHAAETVALWQNAFAALALVPFALAWPGAPFAFDARTVVLIVVLGVLCTAAAHTLFIASMRRVSAHTASVVAALEPVYGIALAAALLGERPTLRTLIGAVLIVGAALYATRRVE